MFHVNRAVTVSLLVALLPAMSGDGQAWLLHAHDEHPWHVHVLNPPCDHAPQSPREMPTGTHEHGDSRPGDSSGEGVVVVFPSGSAIARRCHSGIPVPSIFASPSSDSGVEAAVAPMIFDARFRWASCSPIERRLRTLDLLLSTSHALLI